MNEGKEKGRVEERKEKREGGKAEIEVREKEGEREGELV